MKSGKHFVATRAAKATMDQAVDLSPENIQFVSLLEAKKESFMAQMSPAQLDSINNDEDELEFCLADSVIADYEFAQLLNASREIQVNYTVYKYIVTGADEFGKTRIKTYDKKFYAKWFPGTYQIGFSYNGGFNLKSISMDGGKSTTLSSGTVYGAVKYKGKWLAARINKSKE